MVVRLMVGAAIFFHMRELRSFLYNPHSPTPLDTPPTPPPQEFSPPPPLRVVFKRKPLLAVPSCQVAQCLKVFFILKRVPPFFLTALLVSMLFFFFFLLFPFPPPQTIRETGSPSLRSPSVPNAFFCPFPFLSIDPVFRFPPPFPGPENFYAPLFFSLHGGSSENPSPCRPRFPAFSDRNYDFAAARFGFGLYPF